MTLYTLSLFNAATRLSEQLFTMSIFTALIAPITDIFSKRGEAKHEEILGEQKQEQLETEVEHQETIVETTGRDSYDLEALKQKGATFLDEYYGYMWAMPIMASFVPWLQQYVASGWLMLATVPPWYQAVLVGILASTFGMRWLFDKKQK